METKEICRALQHIKSDRRYYYRGLAKLAKLEAFVESLPEEIKSLSITLDSDWNGEKTLSGVGENTYKALKIIGSIGLGKKLAWDTHWKAEGSILLNNEVVKVLVYLVEQPPNCRLEKYTEVVTKYRAICEDTGKEIGPIEATIGEPRPA